MYFVCLFSKEDAEGWIVRLVGSDYLWLGTCEKNRVGWAAGFKMVSVRINAIPARTGLRSRWDVVKVLEVFIGLRLGDRFWDGLQIEIRDRMIANCRYSASR